MLRLFHRATLAVLRGLRERLSSYLRELSLTETFLGLIVAVITIFPVTVWLYLSATIHPDQSRVQMLDMLVNQTYEAEIEGETVTPLCIFRGEAQLTYVVCDTGERVAIDEFEGDRLALRRFYTHGGRSLFAVDRYQYDPDSTGAQIVQKQRVIFRRVLFFFECGYLRDVFSGDGILASKAFDRFCSGELVQIPPQAFFVSPPPIVTFMPYR
jgi:hypothetical protein